MAPPHMCIGEPSRHDNFVTALPAESEKTVAVASLPKASWLTAESMLQQGLDVSRCLQLLD